MNPKKQIQIINIIFQEKYINYQSALNRMDIISLDERREILCNNFAKKNLNSPFMKSNFQSNIKTHIVKAEFKTV